MDSDAYYGIDVSAIEKAVTPKTKAIMATRLYGQAFDMDSVMVIASAHSLYVVEDSAQSHGATYHGKLTGTFGDVGCFSFYPTKPVGALGDVGAVIK